MPFPLRFEYVPYPLWRRYWLPTVKPLVRMAARWMYPVAFDENPPQDAANMADYLVRFGLFPKLSLQAIHTALLNSQAQIEHVLDKQPQAHAEGLIRLPAQWEPMEAIMLTWPVLYPPLWSLHAEIAETIAPVADVVVVVPTEQYAHAAWLLLTLREKLGDSIDRVHFLVLPTDDIWIRDYGPLLGYDAAGQRVAVDLRYDHMPFYPQTLDNAMPSRWATHDGLPLRTLDLHSEGGNLWTDGAGTLIMSRQVLIQNPDLNRESLEAYLHTVFNYHKLIITPRLNLEETGHVDLIMKLVNANTILLSAPTSRSTAKQLHATGNLLRNETNAAGERYRVVELPTPNLYVNWFAYPIRRSYTNALTVNGRVLVPTYGIKQDETALHIYEDVMRDYEIVPIDCKTGANGGGAVHCLTREVPAFRIK